MSSAALPDRDTVASITATLDTLEPLTPHRYRLTVAEYHRLGEIGIFDEDSRVELIEGDLIAMPPNDWKCLAGAGPLGRKTLCVPVVTRPAW